MHASQTLLILILIIVAAKAAGEIAENFRQPAVLGEIVAGIALAPLLGLIHIPSVSENETLMFIAEIGVILLLFEVGLESEFSEMMRVGLPAMLVACIGVILPLFLGLAAIQMMGYSPQVALFLGGTLTATSVGITARVFSDLRQMHSKMAKIVLGAAVVDDVLGLLVLSVVVGLVAGAGMSAGKIALTVGYAVAFLVVAVVVGVRAAPSLLSLASKLRSRGIIAVTAFVFCLIIAYSGSLLGLAPIVGAFAAGLVLSSTEHRLHITERMQPLADVFVPVFFTVIGMRVDLKLFVDPSILALAAMILAIAIPTKLLAGLGAVKQKVDKLAVGIGMVPRGEVGLIFASIGLTSGILTDSIYGATVVAILLTTLITPPWLKLRLQRTRQISTDVSPREPATSHSDTK